MNLIINREIRKCFSIFIPIAPQEEMEALIKASMIVDHASKLMVHGYIHPEELLEMVEPYVHDMDEYIEEIEINLEAIHLGD